MLPEVIDVSAAVGFLVGILTTLVAVRGELQWQKRKLRGACSAVDAQGKKLVKLFRAVTAIGRAAQIDPEVLDELAEQFATVEHQKFEDSGGHRRGTPA